MTIGSRWAVDFERLGRGAVDRTQGEPAWGVVQGWAWLGCSRGNPDLGFIAKFLTPAARQLLKRAKAIDYCNGFWTIWGAAPAARELTRECRKWSGQECS